MVLWSWSLWSEVPRTVPRDCMVLYGMVSYCIRTLPRGGTYWEIHPLRTKKFLNGWVFGPWGPRGIYSYQNHTLAECTNIHILFNTIFICIVYIIVYIRISFRIKINMNVTLWNRWAYKIQIQFQIQIQMENEKNGQRRSAVGGQRPGQVGQGARGSLSIHPAGQPHNLFISFYCFSF